MAIHTYLAMTAAEFAATENLPEHVAWMACHFSPYGTGLSNLPTSLPPGSLLILNDRIPIYGHDPNRIGQQLLESAEIIHCSGLLLDFQRVDVEESLRLAAHLISALPCPVAVSDCYAESLDCPVFLSPCPHHVPLSEHILPWRNRQIWLDLAADAETITVTHKHSRMHRLPLGEKPEGGHKDALLHCHYSIQTSIDSAQFTLWRTKEDVEELANEADALGIRRAVSLFLESAP